MTIIKSSSEPSSNSMSLFSPTIRARARSLIFNDNDYLKKTICLLGTPPLIALMQTQSCTPFGSLLRSTGLFNIRLARNTRINTLRSINSTVKKSTEEAGKEEIAGELANSALSETTLARVSTTSFIVTDTYCLGVNNRERIRASGGTVPKKVGLASITQNLRLTGGGFSIRFGASAVQMACLFNLAPAIDETLATNTKLTKDQQMFTSTFIISAIKALADNPTKALENNYLQQTANSPQLKASTKQAATTAFKQLGLSGLLFKGYTLVPSLVVFGVLRGLPELYDSFFPNTEEKPSHEDVNNSTQMPGVS